MSKNFKLFYKSWCIWMIDIMQYLMLCLVSLSYSSSVRNLKLRSLQAYIPSGDLWGEFFLFFQLLGIASIPWFLAPSLNFFNFFLLLSYHLLLTIVLQPLSDKDSYWLHWVQLDNPGLQYIHHKLFNLITSARSLLPHKLRVTDLGIRIWTSLSILHTTLFSPLL